MTFPLNLPLFGLQIPPHPVFEAAGYFVGARLYFAQRSRRLDPPLDFETRLWLLVGCVFGAWAGSKLLALAEAPTYFIAHGGSFAVVTGGKTIVGALLGGWTGVELAKRIRGVTASTGDAFVWPIALGTAIGRFGCFFTGLPDRTYGIATTLPWGVDFGDGIRRHPTQVYESAFVLLLAGVVSLTARSWRLPHGSRFRLYLAGYFGFRLAIETIKPREILALGLSAIQWASLLGALIALLSLFRSREALPDGPPLPLR